MNVIPRDELASALSYNEETGVFIWVDSKSIRAKNGSIAGTLRGHGYRSIKVHGTTFYAHRLAWLWVYGVMPVERIDHINMNRDDNRISNLRLATNGQNMQNVGLSKANKSGYKGVSWSKARGKWLVQIRANGLRLNLGYFNAKEDGHAAYVRAALIHHGQYANVK